MKSAVLNATTQSLLIALVLPCFVLLHRAQAVVPAPDGGYPGGNTAEGQNALLSLTTGGFNTANGFLSLRSNATAYFNTAVGAGTLLSNTTGGSNTACGARALLFNTTGSGNIALGHDAGGNVGTANDVICIGIYGANVSSSCYIGNIHGAFVDPSTAATVLVDANGKLGTIAFSSRRFKHDVKPMGKSSEAVLALKPVTFHYNGDKKGTPQFGVIAEEVAEVNPGLVARDKEGKPVSVRYDQVNAMLLNEFLKEHRRVEEQQATIAQLKKEMEIVVARLKEHDSKFQEVSNQIEVNKLAREVVVNNR